MKKQNIWLIGIGLLLSYSITIGPKQKEKEALSAHQTLQYQIDSLTQELAEEERRNKVLRAQLKRSLQPKEHNLQ